MEDMDIDMPEMQRFPRSEAEYVSQDERFELKKQKFHGQQYSQLYVFRLRHAKQFLLPLVKKRWPTLPVFNILALQEGRGCVVIGTLYKEMRLKPSVLDEYSKDRSVAPLVTPKSFIDPKDYLILEDEGGRSTLIGEGFSPAFYVTGEANVVRIVHLTTGHANETVVFNGVSVAVCGYAAKDGEFHVSEILEPGLAPQPPLPITDAQGDSKYVALVSGLRVGASDTNPLQVQLLVDHLTGHLGGGEEQTLSAQIVRCIIAGDSIQLQASHLAGQPLSVKDQRKLSEPMRELDIVLTQLAAAMPVDIMPGANDPANYALPQQPLHECLFPGATAYSTFVRATNPHQFELDGVIFLGTSGQNIDDLDKYSEANDRLDYLERTLNWRHIAPTAPDTIGCYPFPDRDPFLVEPSAPHVYFCGNQDKFSTRVLTGPKGQSVRLICIPRFAETGVAVLVNLKTLTCQCLILSTSRLAS